MAERFYITTPIFYPNARPHMGHAYTTLISDVIARYHRLVGDETYFLTGTDEHGQNIARAADRAGKDPQTFVDETVRAFATLFTPEHLNISFDQFIRTSDQEVHWPGAQELWRRLDAAGDLEKRTYHGLYCVGHEAFLAERDLDENGECPDHGKAPELVEEENYFFKLSRYTDEIKRRIESGELVITPDERRHEILALLEQGLEDVSFSRPREKLSWGIPVPGDESQVQYVWSDALANYLTALGFGRDEKLMDFWPADYHVIGKDILRFHAAIWPGMLLSAGLPLPRNILVHGMITSGGYKMSKTRGNVIDPMELIDAYGGDAVRYYLARHISPFSDGDLTLDGFKDAYNANLANGLGNLAARIMKMAVTYLDAPVVAMDETFNEVVEGEYRYHLEHFEIHEAANVIWNRIGELDAYIQETQPFKTIQTDPNKAKDDVVYLVGGLMGVAHLLAPFLPETAEKIKHAIQTHSVPEVLFPRME